MATRGRAVAAARKKVTITSENLQNVIDNGSFEQLQCCAFVEYDGIGNIKSVEDAVALRRAASGEVAGHVDENGSELEVEFADSCDTVDHRGAVLVTTISSQSAVYPYLEGAGFQRLGTFRGNTGNNVTLWGAQVLQEGLVESKSTTEVVTL